MFLSVFLYCNPLFFGFSVTLLLLLVWPKFTSSFLDILRRYRSVCVSFWHCTVQLDFVHSFLSTIHVFVLVPVWFVGYLLTVWNLFMVCLSSAVLLPFSHISRSLMILLLSLCLAGFSFCPSSICFVSYMFVLVFIRALFGVFTINSIQFNSIGAPKCLAEKLKSQLI